MSGKRARTVAPGRVSAPSSAPRANGPSLRAKSQVSTRARVLRSRLAQRLRSSASVTGTAGSKCDRLVLIDSGNAVNWSSRGPGVAGAGAGAGAVCGSVAASTGCGRGLVGKGVGGVNEAGLARATGAAGATGAAAATGFAPAMASLLARNRSIHNTLSGGAGVSGPCTTCGAPAPGTLGSDVPCPGSKTCEAPSPCSNVPLVFFKMHCLPSIVLGSLPSATLVATP